MSFQKSEPIFSVLAMAELFKANLLVLYISEKASSGAIVETTDPDGSLM